MPITITRKPTSLFFQAQNNAVSRIFHCPWCLKRLFDVTGHLAMVNDNSGPDDQFFIDIKCRNSQCQEVWRVYGPPADLESQFIPKITVNGQPI